MPLEITVRERDAAEGGEPRPTAWRPYLEIRLDQGGNLRQTTSDGRIDDDTDLAGGGGAAIRRALVEKHVVVGRVPGTGVFLDHHTVSRRHAELFCDPFGRHWVRDLGSTNGTYVNGELITERVLQPADEIGIGDFTLTFLLEAAPEASRPRARVHAEDDGPTWVRTLRDAEPPRVSAEHLHTVMQLSRTLITIEDPRERMAALVRLMVRREIHGKMAVALRLQGDTQVPLTQALQTGGEPMDEVPDLSRRVLRALRETHEPVLAGNVIDTRSTLQSAGLTVSREVMAQWVVACPLLPTRSPSGEIDAIYVVLPPECGSPEWLRLIQLATEVYAQSEAAWAARRHAEAHAAIERELDTARQIQEALLPKKLDFPGLRAAVGFEPCKWVGGDYVDAVPMPDGRVLFAVADVCGKGLQAALITSSLRTIVRATADGRALSAIMERVNEHFCEWLPEHSFVTMVAVAIDPATGELECVNAGHPPALIAGEGGRLRALRSELNPALGMAPAKMFAERSRLARDEVLALYTDGITEARDPSREMFGQVRLAELFAALRAPSLDLGAIAAGLGRAIDEFRGAGLPEDDRAFLLARRG